MGPVPGGILFDPLDSLLRWQKLFQFGTILVDDN
jgi:hypothetical protein